MKVKLSWFVFLPVILLLVVIKVLELTGVTALFEFLSAPYLSVVVVIIGFIVSYIFSALDKKTSPVYLLHRNVVASVFSLLSAGCIASKSFLSFFQAMLYSEYNALTFLTSLVGLFASVSLVAISLSHMQGKNYMPRIGMLFISIPVWLCLLLVKAFLDGREVSAIDIDPILMFLCVFGMLLFLNLPMVVAVIQGKNPVKGTVIYGLAFAPLSILYGFNTVYGIIENGFDYSENILGMAFFFLSIYVLSFVFELTHNVSNSDELQFVFDFENYDSSEGFYGLSKEEIVIAENDNEDAPENYDYEMTENEFNDFITEKNDDYTTDALGEIHTDDVLVTADESETINDDGVIFVHKNIAEVFENQVMNRDLDTNDSSNYIDSDEKLLDDLIINSSKTDAPDTLDDNIMINKPVNDEDKNYDKDALDKIDRLLIDLGSIDDI